MRLVQCYECKEKFPKNELLSYCSPNAKTGHNYCSKCYEERLAREDFSYEVCKIFGLKSPGPRIWTERKRLRDNFGYTDATIVNCLRYLYEYKGMKKLAESLVLVTPANVEAAIKWRNTQASRRESLKAMAETTYNYEYARVRENKEEPPELEDLDSCLNSD